MLARSCNMGLQRGMRCEGGRDNAKETTSACIHSQCPSVPVGFFALFVPRGGSPTRVRADSSARVVEKMISMSFREQRS